MSVTSNYLFVTIFDMTEQGRFKRILSKDISLTLKKNNPTQC